MALEYADEVFRLMHELEETARGGLGGRPQRLVVGLSPTLPNLVAVQLLGPAFATEGPVGLILRAEGMDRLMTELSMREVDLVLVDTPIPQHLHVRAFNHPLGSSPIDVFGPPLMAEEAREDFPRRLDGLPFLLPGEDSALRRSIDEWFVREGIHPRIVAEVGDIDLINVLAEEGAGMFAAPAIIGDDLRVRFAVERIGRARGISQQFFAITVSRRSNHPVVVAITESARKGVFSVDPDTSTANTES